MQASSKSTAPRFVLALAGAACVLGLAGAAEAQHSRNPTPGFTLPENNPERNRMIARFGGAGARFYDERLHPFVVNNYAALQSGQVPMFLQLGRVDGSVNVNTLKGHRWTDAEIRQLSRWLSGNGPLPELLRPANIRAPSAAPAPAPRAPCPGERPSRPPGAAADPGHWRGK
jgi:hypothetical protein